MSFSFMGRNRHRTWQFFTLSLILSFTFIASFAQVGTQTVQANTTDLFISEYIEGSSNNKAIEIYNGTGAAVDLGAGNYSLQFFFNGGSTPGNTISLSGSVADGDVFVVADNDADATILAQTDLTDDGNFFNGDDYIVLLKDGTVIDAFGQFEVDPGSQWAGGGQDDTLRRKSTVCQGDADGSDAFDASVEWDSFANNTFDGLGSHTADCAIVSPTPGLVISEVMFNPAVVPAPRNIAVATDLEQGMVYPTFSWSGDQTATTAWYNISVVDSNGQVLFSSWVDAATCSDVCTFTPDLTTLPYGLLSGDYTWWVVGWANDTYSALSDEGIMTVAVAPPALPQSRADTSGNSVTVNWPFDLNTAWVQVYIQNATGVTVYDQWVSADMGMCNAGTCSLMIDTLVPGTYEIYMRAWGAGGFSQGGTDGWSGPVRFNTLEVPVIPRPAQ